MEYIKKNFKILIIVLSVITTLLLGHALYKNIPRLSYYYSEEYDGYFVDKAYGDISYYNIPDTYKGKNVVGIGDKAFINHHALTNVNLPNTILYINRLAFSNCDNLERINLNYIAFIERNAFDGCISLDNLEIGALSIGASSFYNCIKLENVTFTNSLEGVGSLAFAYTNIKELEFPSSVKHYYVDCFKYMNSLEKLYIYDSYLDSVEYINSLSFVTIKEA